MRADAEGRVGDETDQVCDLSLLSFTYPDAKGKVGDGSSV